MNQSPTMPPPPPSSLSLTLIAALTPSGGLGVNGSLPWPQLKKEMAYFARITKRAPSAKHINAVIMGRKTWESIPPRFRPLAGRVNVVLTRQAAGAFSGREAKGENGKESEEQGRVEGPLVVGSIAQAMEALQSARLGRARGEATESLELAKIFVIGGAEVYGKALAVEGADRLLLTRIKREFECDVFFPLRLTEDVGEEGGRIDGKGSSWVRASKEELDRWTGEEVPAGLQSEDKIEWEFEMWEKRQVDAGAR